LPPPPPKKKIGKKYFSGKNHVKFGHFVNFSCMYFRAKMSCPQSWLSSYAYVRCPLDVKMFCSKPCTIPSQDRLAANDVDDSAQASNYVMSCRPSTPFPYPTCIQACPHPNHDGTRGQPRYCGLAGWQHRVNASGLWRKQSYQRILRTNITRQHRTDRKRTWRPIALRTFYMVSQ